MTILDNILHDFLKACFDARNGTIQFFKQKECRIVWDGSIASFQRKFLWLWWVTDYRYYQGDRGETILLNQ